MAQLELTAAAEPRYSSIIGRPIDNTVLSAYMRCPSEAFKAYWLHRRSDGPPSPSIGFGSGWHSAMEAIYKAPECTQDDLMDIAEHTLNKKWEDHGVGDDHRTQARCLLEVKQHLKRYGLPWTQEVKTVGWPENPMVEMNGEVTVPGCRHPYAYKIDRFTGTRQTFSFDDHKTTSQDNKTFFKDFELDNQMMGYTVCGQLITGKVLTGARIRRLVIRTKDSVHDEREIPYSQPRLIAWCKNLDLWLARMERDLEMFKELTEIKGMTPDEAMDIAFPLNKWACHGRKYGQCSYVDVCSMPEYMRGRVLEDMPVAVWNPLENGEDADA